MADPFLDITDTRIPDAPEPASGLDAGAFADRRAERRRARRAKRRRVATLALASLGVAGALAALVIALRAPNSGAISGTEKRAHVPAAVSSSEELAAPPSAAPAPTPIFASYKKLELRVPVTLEALGEVGFHQASYGYALRLKTPLPDADMSKAKKERGTHRDLSAQESGAGAVLTGSVLRMWRSRPGKPDTAVDVGATPGSPVLAPVNGTVVLVKHYKLYGRYADVQIHIIPDGYQRVDCVIIHTTDPVVDPGDRVVAGMTPVASVRKFSDKMNLQLKHYTKKSGDHIHLQLNDIDDPSYEGLKGVALIGPSD